MDICECEKFMTLDNLKKSDSSDLINSTNSSESNNSNQLTNSTNLNRSIDSTKLTNSPRTDSNNSPRTDSITSPKLDSNNSPQIGEDSLNEPILTGKYNEECSLCGKSPCDKKWGGQFFHKKCFRKLKKGARGVL